MEIVSLPQTWFKLHTEKLLYEFLDVSMSENWKQTFTEYLQSARSQEEIVAMELFMNYKTAEYVQGRPSFDSAAKILRKTNETSKNQEDYIWHEIIVYTTKFPKFEYSRA